MILRSVTKHVRNQNWFAVILDFVIVVAGILIALQITNWNANQIAIREEQELITRLSIEFEELDRVLDQRMARARSLVDSTGQLIELIRMDQESGDHETNGDGKPHDDEAVKVMLRDALRYNAPVPPPTAFSDALETGRIGELREVSLRHALNDYQISTEWFASVSGPSPIQNDPNSRLLQGITMSTDQQSWESSKYRVLSHDWNILMAAEQELGVIHRLQSFQNEAYRLEQIAVRNLLAELKDSK